MERKDNRPRKTCKRHHREDTHRPASLLAPARADTTSVVMEKLMTLAPPTRWETLRVVLRDARVRHQVEPLEDGSARVMAEWTVPQRPGELGNPVHVICQRYATPLSAIREVLRLVGQSLGVQEPEALALEWYPRGE